jgi:hypothetical protein
MSNPPLDHDAARKAVDTLPGQEQAEFLRLIQALLERADTSGVDSAALLSEIARRRGLMVATGTGQDAPPYTISKGI